MIRLLTLATVLSTSAWAGTWAVVQSPSNTACPAATTCAVTTSATGTGNGLIATLHAASGITITSVSGGCSGSWVVASGAAASDATAGASNVAYCESSSAGATTVTITKSASDSSNDAQVIEVSTTSGPPVLDNVGNRVVSTAAANLAGATVGTLTGTNDYILQTGIFSGTASACGTQGGTNNSPAIFPNGNATCGFINTITTTANTYTNTSARAALSVIAFKESSAIPAAAPASTAIKAMRKRRDIIIASSVPPERHRVIISSQ